VLSMCAVELHFTVNNIKKKVVVQECFYAEFLLPATVKCT
jgi:hypothetical protein